MNGFAVRSRSKRLVLRAPRQYAILSTVPGQPRDGVGNQRDVSDDTVRPFSSAVLIDVSGLSHPGKVRARNEDHFIVSRIGRYLETMLTTLPPGEVPERAEEAGYAMIVADGMGGHAGGEVASRTRTCSA